MKLLIVFYSFTGNNRLLAEHLARELNCVAVEVVETRKRTPLTIMLDLLLRRWPQIEPIAVSPQDYDHVLFVAPLWNRFIGHPMKSAIRQLGDRLGDYSFVHFSGGDRPKQEEHVRRELVSIVGRPPVHMWAMFVETLVPEEKRKEVSEVTGHEVTAEELAGFAVPGEIVRTFQAAG